MMKVYCPECGNEDLSISGNYYVCNKCGKKTSKEALDAKMEEEDKILARFLSPKSKKEETSESLDFAEKIDRCQDLEDLISKCNSLRSRIESCFYKASFKEKPLFEKVKISKSKITTAISKENYDILLNRLLQRGIIDRDNFAYYKEHVFPLDNDKTALLSASTQIKLLGIGINSSELDLACRDWEFLCNCSHAGAEELPEVKRFLLPIEDGKKYLKKIYEFYKNKNIVD